MQKIKVKCITRSEKVVNLDNNEIVYFYEFSTIVDKDRGDPPLGGNMSIRSKTPQHFKIGADYEASVTADSGLVIADKMPREPVGGGKS